MTGAADLRNTGLLHQAETFQVGASDFLETPGAVFWKRTYFRTPIPAVVLDLGLRLLWVNDSFAEIFGPSRNLLGGYLPEIYPNHIPKETVQELLKKTSAKEAGYSWSGRIEHRGRDRLSIISNLLLVPLYSSPADGETPAAFGGIYDNISGIYRKILRNTFESLLGAARLKDNDTGNHIERVNRYSLLVAERLRSSPVQPSHSQVDREFVESISMLAAMHDVGKIGTPDDILNKAGPLEEWEWEVMKEHTLNGAYVLGTYPNGMAREIALRHHERWNGSGYPHGLAEELIPLSARIVSLADAYDALRMRRSYKDSFTHVRAREIIVEEADTHFDPTLVNVFLEMEDEFDAIHEELRE